MGTPPGDVLQLLTLAALPLAAVIRQLARRRRSDPALCDAAASGDIARVRRLLAGGASHDSIDEDGTTALMAAAFAGETGIVRLLLDHGADPNLQDESGLTALMNAVIGDGEMDLEGGHSLYLEVVEALLEADADADLEDENGSTAADYAELYHLDEVARALAGAR